MATKRRLHVWEHPSLHPAEQRKAHTNPVHVVFEDDEYDFWSISPSDGALCIGLIFEINPKNLVGYKGETTRKEVRYRVSSGMFAKVHEEFYEEEEPVEVPLYDLEKDEPELGARETFNRRLHPDIPLVAHIDGPQPMDGWLPDPGVAVPKESDSDDHTAVLPAIPNRLDEQTGIDLTHITKQVDPLLFSPPPPPNTTETRLDLHSPMLLMPVIGSKDPVVLDASSQPADDKKDSD